MAALCAAALACSGGEKAPAADSGAKSAAGGKADSSIVIAMIAKESANPVFLAARTGAEAAAKELSQ
jgi:ABC-type sugar transport system substrate-binding protein